MKIQHFLLHDIRRRAGSAMAMLALGWGLSASVQAAPVVILEGAAEDARYEDRSQVRVSVLGWSEDEQAQAVVQGFRDYGDSGDVEAFNGLLLQQPTLGYLFTKAATGYSIKYAYVDRDGTGEKMTLLVTPGLKTRNPSLWKTANASGIPFTLVELSRSGEEYLMRTSLDADISVDTSGRLTLSDGDAGVFAVMKQNVPFIASGS